MGSVTCDMFRITLLYMYAYDSKLFGYIQDTKLLIFRARNSWYLGFETQYLGNLWYLGSETFDIYGPKLSIYLGWGSGYKTLDI